MQLFYFEISKISRISQKASLFHDLWLYLGLFPASMAPCFLHVTRGGGTPFTMHSSTAGLFMCTDTVWEPSLIVGATEGTGDRYIFIYSFVAEH